MTLSEAVARVQRHVDDDGTRWNATTVVRPQIKEALRRCQDIMLGAGRTEMAEEIEVDSDTSGIVNLLAYRPRRIHSLAVYVGNRYCKIPAATRAERDVADRNERTYKVYLTRELALPEADGEPLVGDGMEEIPVLAAFEPWVCCMAAMSLAVDDNEQLRALEAEEKRLRKEVLESPDRHGAIVPPAPPPPLARALRWIWVPRTKTIEIVRQWGG